MAKYKKEEIVKAKVIGLQNYGAFVEVDDEYQGLIHISEISYGYVKNINDYVKIGDKIYTEVIKVDESNNQLQLSIKDIDYKNDGKRLIRMAETKSGFEPLKERLDVWISEKIKEGTDKMEKNKKNFVLVLTSNAYK